MYDDIAKKVGIKAITEVESNSNYTAINYSDPITVGVVQWYGTRAAALLNKIAAADPTGWAAVSSSLRTDLTTYPETSAGYWTKRYLDHTEGNSLKPVLAANKPVQNAQIIEDFDDYLTVAERAGMNKDTNTKALLFFFNMYHQSPRQAGRVLASAGPNSSLNRLHAYALNNPVLKNYKPRYDEAKRIIDTWDYSGVDDPATPPIEDEEGWGDDGSGDAGEEKLSGSIKWIVSRGDMVAIVTVDGNQLLCAPDGRGNYIPYQNLNVGEAVPPEDDVDPVPPEPGDPAEWQLRVVKWMTDRVGRYRYSQGPGRNNPDVSGYSDCSAIVSYAYQQVTGKPINGGYTLGQLRYGGGRLIAKAVGSPDIPLHLLQPGDLIYMGWYGGRPGADGVDHVEMYMGDGKCIGHGSGNGPKIKTLNNYIKPGNATSGGTNKWFVHRHTR